MKVSCTSLKQSFDDEFLLAFIRKEYDATIIGVPFDGGCTYRSGTRFGPQGIRRISALYTPYNYEMGVDLREEMSLCDAGDVFTIPANIEKSFDQVRCQLIGLLVYKVVSIFLLVLKVNWIVCYLLSYVCRFLMLSLMFQQVDHSQSFWVVTILLAFQL